MAEVVYSEVAGDGSDLQGTLFNGMKFWLSQRVPQRSRFVANVKANGGEITQLDKQADVLIVDHARKEAPPGSYSFTFIERSIRNGVLEDLEDHKVGPPAGTIRSIGSVIQPAKSSRIKYTQDDDRILWHWVHSHTQRGGGTEGNEIYKQLETQHGRHPWQSWRDRWIKTLKGRPRPAFIPDIAPLTPPSDDPPPRSDMKMERGSQQKTARFTDEDAKALIDIGEDILNIDPDKVDKAWEAWSKNMDADAHRPGKDWRNFWENSVRPIYLKRQAKTLMKLEEPESGTQSRSHPAAKPSRRGPSIDPGSAMTHSKSPPLPVRSPAKASRGPKLGVPRYKPPTVEAAPRSSPVAHRPKSPAREHVLERIRSTQSPHISSQQIPRLAKPLSILESPKRKRPILEDEELPDSSPPELPRPRMTSPKRRKREGLLSRPLEIASTPERSHRRPEPDLQSEEDKVIIVPHDEELEANPLDDDGEPEEDGTIVGRQPSPTLSSPSRRTPFTQPSQRHGTQAVFRDPTQYIDFDVPEPDEGWDDELDRESPSRNLDPNSQLIDSPPSVTVPETQPAVEDTQNILDSRTQMLDLSVAEPDGGWDSLDLVPSSPIAPSHHSSPMPVQRSHTPPPRPRRQSPPKPAPTPVKTYQTALKDWYADVSEDHKSTDISTALRATCCDMELARLVLNYMARKGSGKIPSNEQGIWTEDDDEDVESADVKIVQKVLRKHGKENCDKRLEFLSGLRKTERKIGK